MISGRIRGVSPDKTDCLAKRSWWPIFLPTTSLRQNDTKVHKTDTKVAAESLLAGCFFICLPQEGQEYHIVTEPQPPLTLPEYAVEVCLLC